MWRSNKVLSFFILLLLSCSSRNKQPEFKGEEISRVISRMTDVMVRDITNPPLAARFFSYSLLSGYEIMAEYDKRLVKMQGRLNDYPAIDHPDSLKPFNHQLASVLAIMETAQRLQPSGKEIEMYKLKFLDSCRSEGWDEEILLNSSGYANAISKQILAYAKDDRYNKISNLSRYTPQKKEGSWYPTPPAFIAAVEPNFNTVRPFTLDSASQFKPIPPAEYDFREGSEFYKLMKAVYTESKNTDPEHLAIAAFWDCNPFMVNDKGHLQYAFKKISPGAHWLGISGIACQKAGKDYSETLQVLTTVSIGLMDAFMACWDEKYRSNRIRPETVIRKHLDPSWEPLLQTPPFPEYLSGHSTISTASAVILTNFFGDNFSYTDSVEVPYGLPARSFRSFKEAAEEAGISRFYGGIHYLDAIEQGNIQGARVGEWVIKKIATEKNKNEQASTSNK